MYIVKKFIASIRRHCQGYEVIVLDQENYHNWVSLPNYIIEKFEYGIISVQCLSDIFRLALINNKGGVWIDATIFLCKDLPKDFVTNPFYTCHTINGAKWTGFLMGGQKNNIVIQSVYELMLQYWKKENRLIDYFLLDYLIEVVYRNIPEARILINTIPDNNMEILFFIHHGNFVHFGLRQTFRMNVNVPYDRIVNCKKGVPVDCPPNYRYTYYSQLRTIKRYVDLKSGKDIPYMTEPAIAGGRYNEECILLELDNKRIIVIPIDECDAFLELFDQYMEKFKKLQKGKENQE